MAKLVCAIVLARMWAAAQLVEGTVVDVNTGNGIPGVTVELVRASPTAERRDLVVSMTEGKALYSGTTDNQGRFRIDDVQEGSYTARYRAAGYLDERMAPQRDPVPPAVFAVRSPSDNAVNLQGRMIHFGQITGRLVDDKGHGIPHAFLLLSDGRLAQGMDTDPDGKFRTSISPGVFYTLTAIPQLGWKAPEPSSDGVSRAWSRTYYPGVARLEAAQKIQLPPGGALLDVEMKLAAVPAHAIRGVVLNPDGTPAPKVSITLGVEMPTPALRVQSKPDGTFEFPAVAEGSWRASAELEKEGVKFRALEWLQLGDRDVENVKLQLCAPFSVPLRIVLDTAQGPASKVPLVRMVRVGLEPGESMEPPLPFRSAQDGSLSLDPVYPGTYRFHDLLNWVPAGYYLDSVRLGETLLSAPDVELTSGASPLNLVFKSDGGTVRGMVEKCGAGGVVLTPQDPARRWPAASRVGMCDAKDHYEIPSVGPGEYYVQAFAPGEGSQMWVPQFDESLLNQASRVTARAGERTALDLKLISKQ